MIVLVAPSSEVRNRGGGRHMLVAAAHVRLMIVMLMFVAGGLLILGRLVQLAIMAPPAELSRAAANIPPRGDLLDRNGQPLAITMDAWSIGVHPDKVIGDKRALAVRLADVLGDHKAGWYYQKLTLPVSFTYLQRRALPETIERVNAIGEPGIAFGREPERLYPQSTLAAHALGFVGADGHGMRGMERALDDRLRDPAKRGEPVYLSIDMRVQAALESELSQAMATFQAKGAAGVIMDVHTGEVMAMVSLPTFNPNNIRHATNDELRNNVTQARYELGSVFKPLTIAKAIESGTVTSMAQRFDATQPLHVGRFTIRDDHPMGKWINVPETLIHSSNIATARIAELMGEEKMKALFHSLHFDRESNIEIKEKMPPLWPTYWGRTTTMTTAYGHGIAVTPLHLASAYCALVNGGLLYRPTMIRVADGRKVQGERVFSESTSDRLRQLIRLVVLDGTGRKGAAVGYRVGGKTGTAEVAHAGGYSRRRNVSTFAAAFPMDDPQYVVIATLDSPVGTKETYGFTTAAWNAAPVVSRTITRAGPILGVLPDRNRDIDLADLMPLLPNEGGEDLASVE